MKRYIYIVLIFILISAFASVKSVYAADAPDSKKKSELEELASSIEAVADHVEYDRDEHKITAIGNVVVTYEGAKLTADKAHVYTETKKAYAEGHVKIYYGESILSGDKAYYDFENHQGSLPGGHAIYPPWYAYGEEIEQVSEDEINVYNGWITTCSYERPHYSVTAERVTIYPGDKIIARNITAKVLGNPILWWPFLTIPLDTEETPIDVEPGYSKEFGLYVLTSKTFGITEGINAKANVDWRQKRGFGGGGDINYDLKRLGEGYVRGYLTKDKKDPNATIERPFSDRSEHWRYRLSWRHRTEIDSETYSLLQFNKFSDEYFMQEFFEREYEQEVQPQTSLTLTRNAEQYGFYVNLRKRMNSFYDVIERLPELRFHLNQQEIGETNFYYESDTSMINFIHKFAHDTTDEDHVLRFDTGHELSYPIRWNNINFIPFGNVRETFYSRQVDSSNPRLRTLLGCGMETSTRFYKMWDKEGEFLGIKWNKIRHIVEPSIVYDSIRMTTVSPEDLYHMDGIDTRDDLDIIVFGLENRVQTKRLEQNVWRRVDIVSLNTFLAFECHSQEYGGNRFTRATAELILRPYDWLHFKLDTEYNIVHWRFENANLDIVVSSERIEILLSWRFLKRDEDEERDLVYEGPVPTSGKNQLTLDASYKINDLWTIGGYIRSDFYENLIEEWEIRATRDLHCWLLDIGFNFRNSDISTADYSAYFELKLKAFPAINLKAGHRASYTSPRIGTNVSGSNLVPMTSRVGSSRAL